MIRHLVLFKLNAGTDEATIQEHIADFRALAASIPAIDSIEVGRDFVGRDVSADFGLLVGFKDEAALEDYQSNADHQAAVARLRPNLDRLLVLDYHVT